ncbi:Ndufb8, NADH dehydrogenase 19kDa subunit [Suillus subalutaceus]|uniref:Ndufb8, NADH dehydrogenase 19kDa subunit n=1 Tax=Suillus subalutaceus TaxID=48586 RepID=UPI001B8665A9|nr:Ndufb8, NADH dehydrogenase 19kDa subunit [Suillus subalutaceus]KAG1841669.1 Ndufb8, NADH dehydrogenase 19kDa subunit [Suillus subalutaceus]
MSSLRLVSSVAFKRHLKLSPLLWRAYATPATFKPQEKDPQLGDYPDLPWISNQELPARGWWDQQMRRNFGDPIQEYDEVLSMWGPDAPPVPPHKALFQLSLAISAFVGFGFLCKYMLVPERPTVPREYPYSGLVRELGGLEENKVGFLHVYTQWVNLTPVLG